MMYQQVKLPKKSEKVPNPYTRSLRVVRGTLPGGDLPYSAWGLDPGVNFGLTVIEGKDVHVYHGTLNKEGDPGCYGLGAYVFLREMMSRFWGHGKMTIEGASYGDMYGQVLLSEVRTGFYLAAATSSGTIQSVRVASPMSVRKAVFGNGKIKAPDEWPLLNKNAADSLAIALYTALMLRKEYE